MSVLPLEAARGVIGVLLVDDTVGLRRLMQITLETSGHFAVVGQAGDGIEGIEQADLLQPELVLLDMAMPLMDGLEALPEILVRSPKSKVVVFSGFFADKLAADALALGAVAYIEKGIDPGALIAQLVGISSGEDVHSD